MDSRGQRTRGHGIGQRLRPHPALRRDQITQRGCPHGPLVHHGRLVRPHLQRLRLLRSATTSSTAKPPKIEIDGINATCEGLILRIQKSFLSKDVEAIQPTSARSLNGPSRSPHAPTVTAPGSTMRRARRRSRGPASPTRGACRSTTGRAGRRARRTLGRPLLTPMRHSLDSFVESGSVTSASTGRRARHKTARRNPPRCSATSARRSPTSPTCSTNRPSACTPRQRGDERGGAVATKHRPRPAGSVLGRAMPGCVSSG